MNTSTRPDPAAASVAKVVISDAVDALTGVAVAPTPSSSQPMLVQIPIEWVLLRVGVELINGRLRGFHEVEPLFASSDAAFQIALGDPSRPGILGLLPDRTWSSNDLARSTRRIVETLRKELPKVRADYGSIDPYLRNATPDPRDGDFPALEAAAEAARTLLGTSDRDDSTTRVIVATAEARRRQRLAELGLSGFAASSPAIAPTRRIGSGDA